MKFTSLTPVTRIKEVESEISILKSLAHPHIVSLLDTDFDDHANVLYIFLEFVSQGTITQLVTKMGPTSELKARRFTSHILSGLLYLHSNSIIHRDIKGANCLISSEVTQRKNLLHINST